MSDGEAVLVAGRPRGCGVVDLRWLETFVVVAREGTLRAAADQLGYARSTVTHHVQSLERAFGVPLLTRSRGDRLLSWAGEELLGHAQRAVGEIEEARRGLTGRVHGRRRLLVGATDAACAHRMPLLLRVLSRSCPGVEIVVEVLANEAIGGALERGTVGMAVLSGLDSGATVEHGRRLWQEKPLLLGGRTGASPPKRVLLSEQGCPYRRLVENEYLPQHPQAHVVQVGSLEGVRAGVLSGFGSGLLPLVAAQPWLDSGMLEVLPWRSSQGVHTAVRWNPGRCPQEVIDEIRRMHLSPSPATMPEQRSDDARDVGSSR